MRIELEIIQKIEQYLMGQLSPNDKANFEAEMNQNAELKQNVELQNNIMQGIQRMVLKSSTQNAYRSYKLQSFLTKLIVIAVIATGVTFGVMKLLENKTTTEEPIEYQEAQQHINFSESDSLSADANTYLEQEFFRIETNHDTIVETKDGIVIYIPENAFNTTEAEVDLLLQGAITAEDILVAGLSTVTGDGEELETGGMFYIDAYANGQRVDLVKALTVDVPTDEKKPGMKLYEGEKNQNGEIVWNNPKPLESFLTPVEITSLDFYPPNYVASLNKMGYSKKEFMDSLYYSFACENTKLNYNLIEYEFQMFDFNTINVDTVGRTFDQQNVDWLNAQQIAFEQWSSKIQEGGSIMKSYDNGIFFRVTEMKNSAIPKEHKKLFDEISDNCGERDINDSIPRDATMCPTISWLISAEKRGDGLLDIIFTVSQLNNSYIYSSIRTGASYMPTQFLFNTVDGNFEKVGEPKEVGLFNGKYEELFGGASARYSYQKKVKFVQTIRPKSNDLKIKINYAYHICAYGLKMLNPREDSTVIKIDNAISDFSGINPASIKTIWNTTFNNTNLATREFEERMPWIHKSCNNAVLDLYINNLDKPLSTVDSMALKYLSGEVLQQFKIFAMRGDGRVKKDELAAQKLSAYYEKQRKANAKALAETQQNFWNEQNQKDSKNQKETANSDFRSSVNQNEIFTKEYKKNLCKVYNELDLEKDCDAPPLAPSAYTVRVTNLGWKNIDVLVAEATLARTTTTFSEKGKTSTLTYNPWSATIVDFAKYDRINVYNIPIEFNSYIKLPGTKGKYEYKLNADIAYQTIVLAWTADGIYFYKTTAEQGDYAIALKKTSDDVWRNEIRKSLASITNMSTELDYVDYAQKDQKRINSNKEKQNLRRKIEPVVFPCGGISDTTAYESIVAPI